MNAVSQKGVYLDRTFTIDHSQKPNVYITVTANQFSACGCNKGVLIGKHFTSTS